MKIDTKKLTVSAIMIALSTVLSLVKVWEMPLGGSITLLSMLPVCMVSLVYGISAGLKAAFVYSLGQLALSIAAVVGWGLTPAALVGTILLDYILPFTLLGLAGILKDRGKWGTFAGIIFVMLLRFACHFISGVIIFDIWCEWDNVALYSLCYNGAYMLPETILTSVGAFFLLSAKPIMKFLDHE